MNEARRNRAPVEIQRSTNDLSSARDTSMCTVLDERRRRVVAGPRYVRRAVLYARGR
jgi:hypothetical protein